MGWDHTVRIWDTDSGTLLNSWQAGEGDVWAVAYSPDGTQIATAGHTGELHLWDAETGERMASYLGHQTTVHTIAFSPDGQYLASGGRDGLVYIWPVKPR